VWTLTQATVTAHAPGGAQLTVVHYKAPEFPVAAPLPDESQLLSSTRQTHVQTSALEPSTSSPEWINSSPLTMSGPHGNVVLIEFWEYTCINCIRTFAENKKWCERYHKFGFEIIGMHDPEFDIAYSPETSASQ
jgi:hypothetical protein